MRKDIVISFSKGLTTRREINPVTQEAKPIKENYERLINHAKQFGHPVMTGHQISKK